MKRIFRAPKEKRVYRTVFLLTEEEREKKRPKNLNGGRPPDNATPEQLTEWHRDMNCRNEFRENRDVPRSETRLPDATSVNRLWKSVKTSQERRQRLAEGRCPTHGFWMSQIDGWYRPESGKDYTIVGCPRSGCGVRAKAYGVDGPWELMAADEQPEGVRL
jgi:hypothetical protein